MAALYTAPSPHAAIREANQAGHLRPTVLVAYEEGSPPPQINRYCAALFLRNGSPFDMTSSWLSATGRQTDSP